MAKFNKGILGGFSGTVGNVVGGSWKGTTYMRSKPGQYSDAKTEAQLTQRMKFSLMGRFLRKIQPVIKLGFRTGTQRMTGFNSAMSYNIKNAVSGIYPDLQIDYSKLLVARGDLIPVANIIAESVNPAQLGLNWTDNAGVGSANADDRGLIVVYNSEDNSVVYITEEGPRRQDEVYILDLPESFSGKEVEVYFAFVSADGNAASDSIYAGSVTIAEDTTEL